MKGDAGKQFLQQLMAGCGLLVGGVDLGWRPVAVLVAPVVVAVAVAVVVVPAEPVLGGVDEVESLHWRPVLHIVVMVYIKCTRAWTI